MMAPSGMEESFSGTGTLPKLQEVDVEVLEARTPASLHTSTLANTAKLASVVTAFLDRMALIGTPCTRNDKAHQWRSAMSHSGVTSTHHAP